MAAHGNAQPIMNAVFGQQNGPARVAVLLSGGLDSSVLLAELAEAGCVVHPLYVRTGLFWEEVELRYVREYLQSLHATGVEELTILTVPAQDLYQQVGPSWCLTGEAVPGADTPDEAVYLPGRNVLLLSKALLWCHLHALSALAIGSLAANPFPDATPEFYQQFSQVVGLGVGQTPVRVLHPYLQLHKADVIRRGQHLPLRWTLSCMRPLDGEHCGQCNKCAERQHAFAEAGLPDPTTYRLERSCTA